MAKLGLLHVYTGNGKGKSSAAFGLALRALGQGLRVCVIQFNKDTTYSGEYRASQDLEGLELRQFGSGSFVRGEPSEEDVRLTREGLEYAARAMASGKFDMVILDELNVAVHLKILTAQEALEAIRGRLEEVEVVVTGRYATEELIQEADYVTEMRMVKHPFDRGVRARRGIEF
ncbi:MAG: cob(I)yrinic acid a,c-diamide adenosyltransferase [Methanomassiliicoccales archaeon]